MLKNYKSLIFILLITFLSSFIAGFITQLNIDPWYQSLNKLSFSPPNWIFGPVWTVLYAFMSIAIWVVYEKSKKSDLIFSRKIPNQIMHCYNWQCTGSDSAVTIQCIAF